MTRLALACTLACMVVLAACADLPATNPASPQLLESSSNIPRLEMTAPGHALLGLYSVAIDPSSCAVEVVPLRGAAWHLNAIRFIEPKGAFSLVSFSDISISGGEVELDVSIKHPFPGMHHYCGFDVKGVVIGKADMVDPTAPDNRWGGGSGGLRLLNADGWTRWWNPTEFPDNDTVFSYHDGVFGTPAESGLLDATLSGYKLFAAILEPKDPVTSLFTVPLDHPNGRAVFHSSGIEKRHYRLAFPGGGSGKPQIAFNYAIDACHGFPDGYEPGDYIDVPGGFPPDANQLEPLIVKVETLDNTLYLSPEGCVGGDLELEIWVSDWQGLLAGNPVSEQVESVRLTSPNLFLGTYTAVLTSDSAPERPWAKYRMKMEGLSPDSLYEQQVLITVVSSEGDYQEHVSSYNGSAPLASYYVLPVPVSEEAPPGATGFALNPYSPWPKPGGTIHNSHKTISLGPVNPEVTWSVPDLSLTGMPVVDPEGRVFVTRDLGGGGTTLLVFDSHGLHLAELDYADFEPTGDPILVGCSLLWNDQQGRVQRLFPDGSDEVFFVPVQGPGASAYSMLNMDNSGRAFVHGLNGIQAFDELGSPIWWRFGIDEGPSTFVGPLTVAADGTVVVGKMDLSSGPEPDFKFVGIDPASGDDIWIHEPSVSETPAGCSAADPESGQIYYALENRVVALRLDGGESWSYEGQNYFLPCIAVGPGGTVYSAETVLGQSGGDSRVVALSPLGEELWDFECENSITNGPIVDSAGFVYFTTAESEVYCLYPDGSLRWMRDLYGNIYYLVFGPPRSLLIGLREPTYTATMLCLQDIG